MANEFKVLDLATGKVMLVAETDGSDMLLVIEFSPDGDRILSSRIEERGSGLSPLERRRRPLQRMFWERIYRPRMEPQ